MTLRDPEIKKIKGLPSEEKAALSTPTEDDSDAIKESNLLDRGLSEEELQKLSRQGEHKRNEKFRNQFEYIAIAFLWFFSVTVGALAFSWLWHFLTPVSWHWLTEVQLDKVQNLLTGSIITGLATNHFKKRIK